MQMQKMLSGNLKKGVYLMILSKLWLTIHPPNLFLTSFNQVEIFSQNQLKYMQKGISFTENP